jgi:hypothetical protein
LNSAVETLKKCHKQRKNVVLLRVIHNIKLTKHIIITKESTEALTFTAKSTDMCFNYLISEFFFNVLTRNFSSDALESIFSNVRLRGGSNDLTDSKAAEYSLRQILTSRLMKSVKSSNTMSAAGYASSKILPRFQN